MKIEQLGPYKIGKELGRGGMGTVFAATEIETGRPAAVKVLAPAMAREEGFRERFEAEIESLKKLDHPNIVKLYGYGQQEPYIFFAMELVDGSSLEEELHQGRRFDWQEVCQIGIGVCRALKLAHDHGVIHRDIKPANLLITPDDDIKLTDFGIARLFGNTGLTSEGGVLGTAEFMAPEQADGRTVTHHCDLYSLGGVLYTLLAGRPPFRSKSLVEMLQMQRFAVPEPVRRFAHDTPIEFEQIISQLLEKEPKHRFPNALMLSRRLEAMQRGLLLRHGSLESEKGDSPDNSDSPADGGGNKEDHSVHALGNITVEAEAAAPAWRVTSPDSDPANLQQTSDSASDEMSAGNATPPIASDEFTTVEQARREAIELEKEAQPILSLSTIVLGACLLLFGAVVWYLLQPPSADSLYAEIEAAASAGDDIQLAEARGEIEQFLTLYARDERAAEVRALRVRIETARVAGGTAFLRRKHPHSVVGAEYLAAMELVDTDPDLALVRLRALVNLYDDVADQPPEIRDFILEAKKKIPRLRVRIEQRAPARTALLDERLRHAEKLAQTDAEAARKIYEAIIALYGEKTWATRQIHLARKGLAELPQTNGAN